ncbi:MAG: glycosyltransferase family 2 protein [Dehalococcoidia bacterium]
MNQEFCAQEPLVSIGVPVFNGARFIESAVRSALTQTYRNLEIIISDNASTDETGEICERLCELDPRIQYVRHARNLGAGKNFNEVLRRSRGQYFKWLAHDDLMSPNFVEACVRELELDKGCVLAYPRTVIIDEVGTTIEEYGIKLRTDSGRQSTRFHDLAVAWSMCFEVFGLFRSDVLKKVGGMRNFSHGDGVLLARMGMVGPFKEVPSAIHKSRRHQTQSMRMFGNEVSGGNDYHQYAVWFNPEARGRIAFPTWKIGRELYRAIWSREVAAGERIKCHLTMVVWARKNIRHLACDLVVASRQLQRRFVRRFGTASMVRTGA